MHEDEWVERLRRRFSIRAQPGRVGIGDDACVFALAPDESPVLTVDTLVEGVHFENDWLSDPELGSRLLRVNLSDLAAMAARPVGALLAIETPALPGRVGEAFWNGIEATLDGFDCVLLGGNVTRTPGPLTLSATLLGAVVPGREILRSGARVGDGIWVTGIPGRAARARKALAAGGASAGPCPWTCPEPRIREARELAARNALHAAIDLSDGLGIDLSRLLTASGVGACLDLGPLLARATPSDGPTLDEILEGGEDYELAFAAPSSAALDATDFEAQFRVPLTRIGTVTEGSGLVVFEGDREIDYQPRGWDPFA